MRNPRRGREAWVARLMRQGRKDEAIAYMRAHGMIEAFAGAPESRPVSMPEPKAIAIPAPPAMPSPYPEFKPIRDPVPEGVRWARIKREFPNRLMKLAVAEDTGEDLLVFLTMNEQKMAIARKGRLIGQVFPFEPNPNECPQGWRIWRT